MRDPKRLIHAPQRGPPGNPGEEATPQAKFADSRSIIFWYGKRGSIAAQERRCRNCEKPSNAKDELEAGTSRSTFGGRAEVEHKSSIRREYKRFGSVEAREKALLAQRLGEVKSSRRNDFRVDKLGPLYLFISLTTISMTYEV